MARRLTLSPESVDQSAKRKVCVVPGFRAEFMRVPEPRDLEFMYKNGSAFLSLNNFVRADGETQIPGGPRSTLKDVRNRLTFLPPKSEVRGWSRFERPSASCMIVYFDHTDEFNVCDLTQINPKLHFQDIRLRATMEKIREVLVGHEEGGVAHLETLGLLLLHELASLQQSPPYRHSRGGLSPAQLNRVSEYVAAHLSDPITVSALAALVGVSRFHFIRAFRESVGQSPYQYVLFERVQLAKSLLLQRQNSIDQVAEKVGFKNPNQLSRAFQKLTGFTPAHYRRMGEE